MAIINSDFDDMMDESDEEYYCVVIRVARLRRFHTRRDFNYWDDAEFYYRFRMSKQSALTILDQIRPQIENKTTWNNAISAECMLLLTLRFYATGSFLVAASDLLGASKSSACRIIQKVSHYIALLRKFYIKMPETEEERTKLLQEFYSIARFPRVIAAMDCSHVRIQSPGGENAELFRNRKAYFSINVQTLCSASLKIMDIVARWPGASHDSMIFNNSRIKSRFECGEFGNCFIVADGGYPCKRYIMTPVRQCNTDAETLYNESQIRTRNCVERSYGVWKRRFPVLATGLRLKLQTVQSIIVATAVLHNVCCISQESIPPPLDDNLEELVDLVNTTHSYSNLGTHEDNSSARHALITDYFNNILNENNSH